MRLIRMNCYDLGPNFLDRFIHLMYIMKCNCSIFPPFLSLLWLHVRSAWFKHVSHSTGVWCFCFDKIIKSKAHKPLALWFHVGDPTPRERVRENIVFTLQSLQLHCLLWCRYTNQKSARVQEGSGSLPFCLCCEGTRSSQWLPGSPLKALCRQVFANRSLNSLCLKWHGLSRGSEWGFDLSLAWHEKNGCTWNFPPPRLRAIATPAPPPLLLLNKSSQPQGLWLPKFYVAFTVAFSILTHFLSYVRFLLQADGNKVTPMINSYALDLVIYCSAWRRSGGWLEGSRPFEAWHQKCVKWPQFWVCNCGKPTLRSYIVTSNVILMKDGLNLFFAAGERRFSQRDPRLGATWASHHDEDEPLHVPPRGRTCSLIVSCLCPLGTDLMFWLVSWRRCVILLVFTNKTFLWLDSRGSISSLLRWKCYKDKDKKENLGQLGANSIRFWKTVQNVSRTNKAWRKHTPKHLQFRS